MPEELIKDKEMSKLDSIIASDIASEDAALELPPEPSLEAPVIVPEVWSEVVPEVALEVTPPVIDPAVVTDPVATDPDKVIEEIAIIDENIEKIEDQNKDRQQSLEDFIAEADEAKTSWNVELLYSMVSDASDSIRLIMKSMDEQKRLLSEKDGKIMQMESANSNLSKSYENTASELGLKEIELFEKSKLYDQVNSDGAIKALITLRTANQKNPDKYGLQYAESLKQLVQSDLGIDINDLAQSKRESVKQGIGNYTPWSDMDWIPSANSSSALNDISM